MVFDSAFLTLGISPRYTSGDVRLWDTLHWDSGALNLQPAHIMRDEMPLPYVSLVQVTDTVACAAYENGERFEGFMFIPCVRLLPPCVSKICPDFQGVSLFGAPNLVSNLSIIISTCSGCVPSIWAPTLQSWPLHQGRRCEWTLQTIGATGGLCVSPSWLNL